MGSIFPRRRKLYIKFKDEEGEWTRKPTPYDDTDEGRALASELLAEVERGITARVQLKAELGGGPISVKSYALRWVDARIEAAKETGEGTFSFGEKSILEHHIIPTFGHLLLKDVTTLMVKTWVGELKKKPSRKGGKLAPRTVNNIFGVLHTLYEHAVSDELVPANPVNLPKGVVPARDDKDPAWRDTAIYTKAEVEVLISSPIIPLDRHTINAILFIAGTRWGEMCALEWRDWEPQVKPLGKLRIVKSFSFDIMKLKTTKTKRARYVPVHPVLAKILAEWKLHGWAAMMGRQPMPTDLIVPNAPTLYHSSGKPLSAELQAKELARVGSLPAGDKAQYRRPQLGLKRLHDDCEQLGIPFRRNHDCRRTTASILLDDGARDPVRHFIVWGPSKKNADQYTTLSWKTYCEEMLKLQLERREGQLLRFENGELVSAEFRFGRPVDRSS